jgi:hypothetical protein
MEGIAGTVLRDYLATTDLDELLARRQALDYEELTDDDERTIGAVLDDWTDVQAVSNLLIHAQLIPSGRRNAEIQHGLDDVENPYIRLAAVLGLAELDAGEVGDHDRQGFVRSLLDLIQSDGLVCAERASFAIVWLMRQPDAPDVLACLGHPSDRVRHNLAQGLLGLLGSDGLAALLDLPGFVEPDVQELAHATLADLGIDLSLPADEQRKPFVLAYVPNYSQFDPAD